MRWTILQPSVIFGPGDSFANRFARLLTLVPLVFPLAMPGARFAPVHVDDVVEAVVRAIEIARDRRPDLSALRAGGTDASRDRAADCPRARPAPHRLGPAALDVPAAGAGHGLRARASRFRPTTSCPLTRRQRVLGGRHGRPRDPPPVVRSSPGRRRSRPASSPGPVTTRHARPQVARCA